MPPVLRHVTRLDAMPVNQTFFTEEGYLRDRPVLTSTGIFEYRNPDGSTRRELRLPEEVFNPESLKSYCGKPVIITHDAGLVTKDNVGRFQIGTILTEGMRSGNDVRADIIIHDTDEMKECGLKELSLGYNLDLEEEPGEWHGMPYDAIQRNIRINHLALVREARAGEQARLNIDSRDSTTLIGGKTNMGRIRKNARHADSILSPEELEKAIAEYKAKHGNQQAGTDADDVKEEAPKKAVAPSIPIPPKAEEEPEEEKPVPVAEEVKGIKENRAERAEAGQPEDADKAKALIKDQDDDIGVLIDIIDTLLAERDFKAAKKDAEDVPEEEKKPEEADPFAEGEDEPVEEEKPEEEVVTDADEEVIPEEEEEVAKDCKTDAEDDEEADELLAEDEDEMAEEEDIPAFKKTEDEKKLNTDSVDRIVRQRIQLGIIGRKLNLDGLENKGILAAKKAVIKAVRPGIRLDGKSTKYINAAYDLAVDDVKKRKTVADQKRKMFNKDSKSARTDSDSANAARERMIERRQNRQ